MSVSRFEQFFINKGYQVNCSQVSPDDVRVTIHGAGLVQDRHLNELYHCYQYSNVAGKWFFLNGARAVELPYSRFNKFDKLVVEMLCADQLDNQSNRELVEFLNQP